MKTNPRWGWAYKVNSGGYAPGVHVDDEHGVAAVHVDDDDDYY